MNPKTESWILIARSLGELGILAVLAILLVLRLMDMDRKLDWLLSRQPPAAQVAPESKP